MSYKLVYTDDKGSSRELTQQQYEEFKQKYPKIAELLINPDDNISDEMIQLTKSKETWEKTAKKLMQQIWKSKNSYLF